MIMEFDKRGE